MRLDERNLHAIAVFPAEGDMGREQARESLDEGRPNGLRQWLVIELPPA